ncbi:MAG: sigma 54-interacting transcriptional regulator [Pirellulaceae bacterium]
MPTLSHQLTSDSIGLRLLPGLIDKVVDSSNSGEFLNRALQQLVDHQGIDGVAISGASVVRGIKGTWRRRAGAGSETDLPTELLADVLDQYQPLSKDSASATPLFAERAADYVFVIYANKPVPSPALTSLAAALAAGYDITRQFGETRQRAERLSAMLEMTVRWNQSHETDELLQTMVETSTQLLDAERATIFLLDPNSGILIGRPALGVEGGELRVAQGAGVVGQVVQSGEPQRIDVDIENEQAQIDRTVDAQTGFVTRSLVCVPMFDQQGETLGAFELLNKREGNFTQADQDALGELAGHAAVAINNTQHVENLRTIQCHMADQAAEKVQLIGDSAVMQALKETIHRVADTELAVLTLGENGTGKEVVAQMIHYLSPRRDNVLVAVNCAAITETLLESELFGHEKGAFTDAHEARQGKFELADGGTLFLDEIGDMSPGGQAKLLRVLEEKVVVRVGGSQPIPTDARVIAATNQDLGQLVREKKFREDLFFRLNVVTLQLPPLRERGEDITTLGQHFLKDFCARARRPVPKFTAAARKKLIAHNWPGNVRELRNMMERLAYLFNGEKVDAGDLSFVMAPGQDESVVPMDLPLAEATRQFQADYIQRHIKRAQGNMTDAAERMGLHRSNLYRKMKQLGMDQEEE